MTTTNQDTQAERLDGPIHQWFSLSYSNYLVLHRTMMQSMPVSWQERAVALFEELDAAFPDLERPDSYIVEAATECQYSDLSSADMAELGISHYDGESARDLVGVSVDDDVWVDRKGEEHRSTDRVLVPLLGGDPVPHYNRGRTFIEPVTQRPRPTWTAQVAPFGVTSPAPASQRLEADGPWLLRGGSVPLYRLDRGEVIGIVTSLQCEGEALTAAGVLMPDVQVEDLDGLLPQIELSGDGSVRYDYTADSATAVWSSGTVIAIVLGPYPLFKDVWIRYGESQR